LTADTSMRHPFGGTWGAFMDWRPVSSLSSLSSFRDWARTARLVGEIYASLQVDSYL
jgi:hypothetical protein